MIKLEKIYFIILCISMCLVCSACGDVKEQKPIEVIFQEDETTGAISSERDKEGDGDAISSNGEENGEDKEEDDISTGESARNEGSTASNAEEQVSQGNLESISGSIKSVDSDSFTIIKAEVYEVETEEGKGEVMTIAGTDSEQDRVKVLYTESTQFVLCTSTDGINGKYEDVTSGSLSEGSTVDIEGTYEGADFKAVKVTSYRFLW